MCLSILVKSEGRSSPFTSPFTRLVRLELKKVVVGFSVSVQKTKDGVLTLRLSVQVGKVGFWKVGIFRKVAPRGQDPRLFEPCVLRPSVFYHLTRPNLSSRPHWESCEAPIFATRSISSNQVPLLPSLPKKSTFAIPLSINLIGRFIDHSSQKTMKGWVRTNFWHR